MNIRYVQLVVPRSLPKPWNEAPKNLLSYSNVSRQSITTFHLTYHSPPSGRVLCEDDSPFTFRDQKWRFATHWEFRSQTIRCTPNSGSIAMLITTTKADCHLYIRSYRGHLSFPYATLVTPIAHSFWHSYIEHWVLGFGPAPMLPRRV